MIERFLRRNLTTLGYILSGYPMLPHLRFLRNSQYWSTSKLENYQLDKFRNLVTVATKHIPYYQELLTNHGIDSKRVKSLKDLEQFPVLTKVKIKENFPEKLMNRSMHSSDILIHKTGGSTGEPLSFGYDKTTVGLMMALVYRSFEWLDFTYGDKILYFVGMGDYPKTVRERLKETLADKIVINAYYLEESKLASYYKFIERNNIRTLYGYPSAIAVLCSYCEANGLRFSKKLIVVTTGEVLTEHHRIVIQKYLGYKIYDQYGCREINSVAFESPDAAGMYINMEHVIVEVLDDQDRPLPPGEIGNLVITDLDNYAMPMIRYRFGDKGILLPRENKKKGIQLDRMGFVEGRETDILYRTDRTPVTGIYFVKLMRGGLEEMVHYNSLGIILFQVVQKDFQHIMLNIMSERKGSSEAEEELKTAFHKKLGPVTLTINWVEQIPASTSGKRRMIVSEIQSL